jgi:DNA-binding protein HU-beta
MNKNELIEQVAGKTGLTKSAATEAVEAMLESISHTLESGEEVKLVGFGSFRISERKASTGRNPRTGEPIEIDAVRNIKFRQGTDLRERVNSSRKSA